MDGWPTLDDCGGDWDEWHARYNHELNYRHLGTTNNLPEYVTLAEYVQPQPGDIFTHDHVQVYEAANWYPHGPGDEDGTMATIIRFTDDESEDD